MATQHLIDLGQERVAFVGEWEDFIGFHPTVKRRKGYVDAMTDAGLRVPDG